MTRSSVLWGLESRRTIEKRKMWGVLRWVTNSNLEINQVLFKDRVNSDCPAYLQKSIVLIGNLARDLKHSDDYQRCPDEDSSESKCFGLSMISTQ